MDNTVTLYAGDLRDIMRDYETIMEQCRLALKTIDRLLKEIAK